MKRKPTLNELALWAALPMAHTPRIEGRLKMILNTDTRRTLPRRAGTVGLALAAALLVPLAAARPVPADSAPAKGTAAPIIRRAALPPTAAWTLTSAKDRAAERRLKRAEAADPTSPRWPGQLGFLYLLNVADDGTPASRAWARASLVQYDRAGTLAEQWVVTHRHVAPHSGEPVSEGIARMAFAAGEYDRARRCALALLQPDQSGGPVDVDQDADNAHAANLILGRLALRAGDTAQAERHLLAMGRVSGSPVLDTFGPNMRLAKDLLAARRRGAVLAYFDECGHFWKSSHLADWRSDVTQGKMPHFGANLYH